MHIFLRICQYKEYITYKHFFRLIRVFCQYNTLLKNYKHFSNVQILMTF